MSFIQYLKDTRSELNHVAWPTRVQTIIYTVLVISLSVLVALYLGLFDFLFTSGLARVIEVLPGSVATPAPSVQLETSAPGIQVTVPGQENQQ
jgi:preprotein translocase SecE subunit